jgi:hypothetical protein
VLPLSLQAVVGGGVCFAQALVLVRRSPRVHPVTMNAVLMAAGAAVLVAGSAIAGEPHARPRRAETRSAWLDDEPIGSGLLIGGAPILAATARVLAYATAAIRSLPAPYSSQFEMSCRELESGNERAAPVSA